MSKTLVHNVSTGGIVTLALLNVSHAVGSAETALEFHSLSVESSRSLVVENATEMTVNEVSQMISSSHPDTEFQVVRFVAPTTAELDFKMTVPLPDGTGESVVIFRKHSVRGPNFAAYYEDPRGVLTEFDPGPVTTMRAYDKLTNQHIGLGLITPDGIEASVRIGNETINIQPVSSLLAVPIPNQYVVSKAKPIQIDNGSNLCGINEASPSHTIEIENSPAGAIQLGATSIPGAGSYIVELACRADASFVGNGTIGWNDVSAIEWVVNSASGEASAWNTDYIITSLIIETSSYAATSPQVILDHFRVGAESTFADHPYDAGLFFTNASVNGAQGFAGTDGAIPAFCNNNQTTGAPQNAYAYVVFQDVSGIGNQNNAMSYIAWHELGHLWGLEHSTAACPQFGNDPNPVMCANAQLLAFDSFFTPGEIDIAENTRDSAWCIDRELTDIGCRISHKAWGDASRNVDLNSNFVLDTCELDSPTTYDYSTNAMLPFNHALPQSQFFTVLPTATSDVSLTMIARGDFDATNETVDLYINDVLVHTYFTGSAEGNSCGSLSEETLVITRDTYNTALSMIDTTANIPRDIFRFEASSTVTVCDSVPSDDDSFVRLQMTYETPDRDGDNNGILDEYEIVVDGESLRDCNGNRAFEVDCNGNGIPDDCDISNGGFDCNNNGLIDYCETTNPLMLVSPKLVAPDSSSNEIAEWTFDVPVQAIGNDVRIEVESVGELRSSNEYFELSLNGQAIGDFFDNTDGSDCNIFRQSVLIDRVLFNTLVTNNQLTATVTPFGVDTAGGCADDYVRVSVVYNTASDVNGNGVPDSCDIAEPGNGLNDKNGNGIIDQFEVDCDHLDSGEVDSDGDGISDNCEISGYRFKSDSKRVSPLDGNLTKEITFSNMPEALGNIAIHVRARGDIGSANENVDMDFGVSNQFTIRAFDTASIGNDCDELSTEDFLSGSSGFPSVSMFNAAIDPFGDLLVSIDPSSNVNQFDNDCDNNSEATFFEIQISYDTVPEADCNENDIPDSWDISSGGSLDINGDQTPDECQPFRPDPSTIGSGSSDLSVVLGTELNASLEDAVGSDDVDAVIRIQTYDDMSGIGPQSWAGIETGAYSSKPTGATSFYVEYEFSLQNLSRKTYYDIRAYNWTNNSYESIHSGSVTTGFSTERVVSHEVTTNASQYVNSSNGRVSTRIFFWSPPRSSGPFGGPLVYPLFDVHLDDMYWIVK